MMTNSITRTCAVRAANALGLRAHASQEDAVTKNNQPKHELHEGMKDYSRNCRCGERFVIHPTGRCKNCLLSGLRYRR